MASRSAIVTGRRWNVKASTIRRQSRIVHRYRIRRLGYYNQAAQRCDWLSPAIAVCNGLIRIPGTLDVQGEILSFGDEVGDDDHAKHFPTTHTLRIFDAYLK